MEKEKTQSAVAIIKAEITQQLAHPETAKSLLDTTFKGLDETNMKRALLEGMLRGFTFKDFLNKDVYAIPYATGYSLVASIDHFRKIGARSGVVGVEAPTYQFAEDSKKVLSCRVTVKKRFSDGYIGDFTAEVDFAEYSTGKNLWTSKPKTMIAKVAEMHALRKACPEELAQVYVEEEMQKTEPVVIPSINLDPLRAMLKSCKTAEELERAWADIPGDARAALKPDLEDVKAMITSATADIA